MPKTLLLADDSVTIQKVVGISFANEDVTLLTVDNGDDAIARTREGRMSFSSWGHGSGSSPADRAGSSCRRRPG